eukprot:760539-Hanusia_phi.AAC.3
METIEESEEGEEEEGEENVEGEVEEEVLRCCNRRDQCGYFYKHYAHHDSAAEYAGQTAPGGAGRGAAGEDGRRDQERTSPDEGEKKRTRGEERREEKKGEES